MPNPYKAAPMVDQPDYLDRRVYYRDADGNTVEYTGTEPSTAKTKATNKPVSPIKDDEDE